MGALSELLRILASLWQVLLSVTLALFSFLAGFLPAPVALFVASLPAFLVGFVLFGVAAILNARGVPDVHATLDRTILARGRRTDGSRTPELPAPRPAEVTDTRGRFSSDAFQRTTGLTPAEFIHLFVSGNGGTVKQTTLNRCLPWSKTSVCRYLDDLEANDVVRRVSVGGQNLVCLPDAIPDEHSATEP